MFTKHWYTHCKHFIIITGTRKCLWVSICRTPCVAPTTSSQTYPKYYVYKFCCFYPDWIYTCAQSQCLCIWEREREREREKGEKSEPEMWAVCAVQDFETSQFSVLSLFFSYSSVPTMTHWLKNPTMVGMFLIYHLGQQGSIRLAKYIDTQRVNAWNTIYCSFCRLLRHAYCARWYRDDEHFLIYTVGAALIKSYAPL